MRYVISGMVLAVLLVGCGDDSGQDDASEGRGLAATCAAIQEAIPPGKQLEPDAESPDWIRVREGVEDAHAAADPETAALLEPLVEATRGVTAFKGADPDVWLASVNRWMRTLQEWRSHCLGEPQA